MERVKTAEITKRGREMIVMARDNVTVKKEQEEMAIMTTEVEIGQNKEVLIEIIDRGQDLIAERRTTARKVRTVMEGTVGGPAKIGSKTIVGIGLVAVHREEGEVKTGISGDKGIKEANQGGQDP